MAIWLFATKVDSIVEYARWLFISDAEVEVLLDSAYDEWARGLLVGGEWCTGAVCTGELGWTISGFGRAVCSATLRRACILSFPAGDIYQNALLTSELLHSGQAVGSERILASYGIEDVRAMGGLG